MLKVKCVYLFIFWKQCLFFITYFTRSFSYFLITNQKQYEHISLNLQTLANRKCMYTQFVTVSLTVPNKCEQSPLILIFMREQGKYRCTSFIQNMLKGQFSFVTCTQ